jgi:hypothetical protein
MSEFSVTKSFRIRRNRHGQKRVKPGSEVQQERVSRITRLMALAIQFDHLIRNGMVADQAEIARRGLVSRARLTQIMDLLLLAPEIQESLLQYHRPGLPSSVTERQVRIICGLPSWETQLALWRSGGHA